MLKSSSPPIGETSRIKNLMGRTPSIDVIKSKFLTVLGNSNDLLNGISSKLVLNISSSGSEFGDDDDDDADNDDEHKLRKFDESIDYTKIDYESRRVKARRAHEEIISGRYRQPNLTTRQRFERSHSKNCGKSSASTTSKSSTNSSKSSSSTTSRSFSNYALQISQISSTTRSESIESRNSGGYERDHAIAGARRSDLDLQRDLMRLNNLKRHKIAVKAKVQTPHIEVQSPHREAVSSLPMESDTGKPVIASNSGNSIRLSPAIRRNSNSSTLTSLHDDLEMPVSLSAESTDWQHFIRSESQNSVPSWASSISLDCRVGEEPIKEFMKRFTQFLFNNANSIDRELKCEFGAMVRLDIGRQWFTRFILQQHSKSKRVNELTFLSLIQYFAIILFECAENEDYSNATIITNLCFIFYREIEVPGCEPYREYLFTFIREQPIWLTVRFWNTALGNCLQNERDYRLALHNKKRIHRQETKMITDLNSVNDEPLNINAQLEDNELTTTNSKTKASTDVKNSLIDIEKDMENITFRKLGAITCDIHALGVPQDVCLAFFEKQISTLNLSNDKIKLIRDNIYRMYHETDVWGAKQDSKQYTPD